MVDVWIPIDPKLVIKILSLGTSFILTGLSASGFVPIPIEVIVACEAVKIPAIDKLFNVDIPTVVLELPCKVLETLPVNVPCTLPNNAPPTTRLLPTVKLPLKLPAPVNLACSS